MGAVRSRFSPWFTSRPVVFRYCGDGYRGLTIDAGLGRMSKRMSKRMV